MKKIVTLRPNRVCKFAKCGNLLSIYNVSTFCYTHQRLMANAPLKPVVAKKIKAN